MLGRMTKQEWLATAIESVKALMVEGYEVHGGDTQKALDYARERTTAGVVAWNLAEVQFIQYTAVRDALVILEDQEEPDMGHDGSRPENPSIARRLRNSY